ncbi:MAG: hypothetical protein V3T33_04835, partial [Myxococcota bacterium]
DRHRPLGDRLLDYPHQTRWLELPLRLYFLPERADEPKYDLARRLRERDITDYRLLAHAALVDNPD